MKRIIAMAVLAAALSHPAFAGDRGHERQMERLTEELQLDDGQAKQVQAIMKEQHEKMRALWDSAKGDKEQVKAQASALHEETKARLGKVLNAEQMAKMDKKHEERMAKMKDRHGDRHDFIEELQLSDEQTSQVKQILKEQHEKKRAMFDKESDRAAKHTQMQALHDETKTRLATVLNEQQLAKFEEAHQQRMEKRKAWHKRGKDTDGAKKEAAAPE